MLWSLIKSHIRVNVNGSLRSLFYSLRPWILKQLNVNPKMFEIKKRPSLMKNMRATTQNTFTEYLILKLRQTI